MDPRKHHSLRRIIGLALLLVPLVVTARVVAAKVPGPERLGYYVFIGKGDYKDEYGPRTQTYTLADWSRLIDDLKARGATTFIPLVTGHRLPYPSRAFPDYIETDANTAKGVDLQRIIDRAKAAGLEVILAFTTTGHCRFYAQDHPEYCIIKADGSPASGLCPNRKGAGLYPLGIVEEVLTTYRNFDGILIHPPEIEPACYCPDCRKIYTQKTGQELASAGPVARQRFFVETYLRFAAGLLARAETIAHPKVKLMFNCNWLDDHVDLMSALPDDLDIIYWDYDLRDGYLEGRFRENLSRYLKMTRTIWFMPSTEPRWWTPAGADREWGCAQVAKQLRIAREAGVRNIGIFIGAIVNQDTLDRITPARAR